MSMMHFWDEAVYLQNAEVICCGKTNYSELGSRPPLLSLFFVFIYLFWHHIYAACIATALLNALGPALLFLSGRRIAGTLPAVIASLLLAFSPFFVGIIPAGFNSDYTGNSLLSDSPALTLILLAFWLMLRALDRQTAVRFAFTGFVMALAVLMRFASLSTVGMISLLAFTATRRWRSAAACGIGFVVGGAPYLCWSRIRYGEFLATFNSGWANLDGPEESPLFYLRNFANIFGWIAAAGLALWLVNFALEKCKLDQSASLNGSCRGVAEGGSGSLVGFLWLWAVAVLVCFSILSHKEPRYILPLAPPLLLLAGTGLSVLVKSRQRALRFAGAALLTGALGATFLPTIQVVQSPFIDHDAADEITASDFLTRNLPPSTVLYSTNNYPVFAYYTNLKVNPVLGTGADLHRTLDHLKDNGVFIAYRDDDAVDGPSLKWLDEDRHFRRLREYPSMVLYSYRAGD
jgi:hypothetical protein